MNSIKKKSKIDSAVLWVILSLAWPTMLEELMHTAVQYVDTAMVGSLGTAATAAVGSTTTVNWLIGSSLSAFGIGFLSYISKAIGEGDEKKAAGAAAQAVSVTVLAGLFFTVLTLSLSTLVPVWMQVDPEIRDTAAKYFFILYAPMLFRAASIVFGTVLRAAGDTKTPMRIGILVNCVNVVLNFLLIYKTRTIAVFGNPVIIFGADMGVMGAATASAVAYTIGGILISVALFRHKTVSPVGHSFIPEKSVLRDCMRVALPNMAQRFCTSLGYVFFASMINSLGSMSTAAHTIANTVESAFYMPGYGMQEAAATLTGNCIGAKDEIRRKKISDMTVALEVTMMIISGTLLFIFAPRLMGIFSKDEAVIKLGSTVLRMVAVSEPFYGVSIVTEGMLQGAGKTVMPFVFSISSMWGIRIAGTFVCTQLLGLGLVAAWGCMIGNNILLFILFRIYYRKGNWNPLAERKEIRRKYDKIQ